MLIVLILWHKIMKIMGWIEMTSTTFEEHEKELSNISSAHRKFYGFDVSRWVIGGGLSVAAALTHNLGLAVLAAVSPSIVGAPSIPDLRKQWHELRSQSKKLQRFPTAILFRHLGHKFGFSQ